VQIKILSRKRNMAVKIKEKDENKENTVRNLRPRNMSVNYKI
jgi:DNA recombination-dependent growth factor C